ncbi:glutamine--fructose-6-phosphate transaminase (isomerizing) [Endozoicomonas sp. SM1973]|uniref:Glutamine--fructose-6-phosphate aminotransferase [isomerizing] n=1 Tax=Spartinivicinus marinus TaxID=2994442 RepID=A0A853IF20_9GAMM|nr:glutamine--fructose-6-phosphate transaminase (isomerizing) [Spartinivicinus marinus]MCX4027203.1 glutamine--fructose-6-phosphate transaminase (isomerizing) [Spartinivicinus marinus]NYZ66076.1 glutamine--fructose-6-phosphate transaminase (isomerizing) [Spartinivicinus marinus]
MCGIFAYIGKNNAVTTVVQGLQRLEYRGYDSWGLAIPIQNSIEVYKTLDPLQTADITPIDVKGAMALGHTRWATHGAVNITNCHPHVSSSKQFSLVHNGIVENYQALKTQLVLQEVKFVSETDTEVIVRLIENELNQLQLKDEIQKESRLTPKDYQTAISQVFKKLEGRNTLVLICAELQLLIGIRNGSPLIAGIKPNNITADSYDELFLASDYYSFAQHTHTCLLVNDLQMICCEQNRVQLIDLHTNKSVEPDWQILERQELEHSREGFSHFMIKEIQQQWETIPRAAAVERQQLEAMIKAINNANNVFITGAGAAFFIGEQIAAMLREIAGIFATPIPAYESESYLASIEPNDVLIAISQSGETADTLNFIEQAKRKRALVASVVNMPGAMLSRLSDFAFLSYAGPEVCVLSTKSSTSQLTFGYLLAKTVIHQYESAKVEIEQLIHQLSHYFNDENLQIIESLAQKITGDNVYLLGNRHFIGAGKIGALNIKEASYIHAEAFPAGELKHGVIALIEKGTPVICFMDETNATYMTAIASEVKARGGMIIGISQQPNELFDYMLKLPVTDNSASLITHIIPCQLLAYYLAIQRGHNPDKPRNLAKSVTVI